MSRYHFHFTHGDDIQPDCDGIEYDDLQALREDVIRTLAKSIEDDLDARQGGEIAVEVQDAAGRRVLSAMIAVTLAPA